MTMVSWVLLFILECGGTRQKGPRGKNTIYTATIITTWEFMLKIHIMYSFPLKLLQVTPRSYGILIDELLT